MPPPPADSTAPLIRISASPHGRICAARTTPPGDRQPGIPYLPGMNAPHHPMTTTSRLRSVVLLILGLTLSTVPALACDEGKTTAETGLMAEDFVAIVVALREAEREVTNEDSAIALFAERKAQILSRHGTTEEELRAFLLGHGDDPDALRQSWDGIAERLKHVPPEDGPMSPRQRRRLRAEPAGEQTLH